MVIQETTFWESFIHSGFSLNVILPIVLINLKIANYNSKASFSWSYFKYLFHSGSFRRPRSLEPFHLCRQPFSPQSSPLENGRIVTVFIGIIIILQSHNPTPLFPSISTCSDQALVPVLWYAEGCIDNPNQHHPTEEDC